MNFDNKTILITGLLVCAVTGMVLQYEQIALAIVSGLVGYLSKDKVDKYLNTSDTSVDTVEDGEYDS